jgi:hypothetical protein
VTVRLTPQGCQVTTVFNHLPDGRRVEHVTLENPPLRIAELPEPLPHAVKIFDWGLVFKQRDVQ